MAIAFSCPSCGRNYNVDERFAGKSAKCKQCGTAIPIPAAAAPAAARDEDEDFGALASLAAGTPAVEPPAISPHARRSVLVPPVAPPSARGPRQPAQYAAPSPLRPTSSGLDAATPLLILGFFAATIVTIVRNYKVLNADRERFNLPLVGEYIWYIAGGQIASYLLVVGPLLLFGVWIASKITRFALPDVAYLRALGLGAIPFMALAGTALLMDDKLMAIVASMAFSLFAGTLLLHFGFGLKFLETLVSMAFAALFFLGVIVFNGMMTTSIARDGRRVNQAMVDTAGRQKAEAQREQALAVRNAEMERRQAVYDQQRAEQQRLRDARQAEWDRQNGIVRAPRPQPGGNSAAYTPPAPVAPPVSTDPVGDRIRKLTAAATPDRDRDDFKSDVDALQYWADNLSDSQKADVLVIANVSLLKEARARVAALPSGEPPETLYGPAGNLADLNGGRAATLEKTAGIAFNGLHFDPSPALKHDLSTSGVGQPLVFFSPDGQGKLTLSTVKRVNAKQLRPWVVTNATRKARGVAAGIDVVDADPTAAVSTGRAAGIEFTRVTTSSGAGQTVKYMGLWGPDWLLIETSGAPDALVPAVDALVRTLRKPAAGVAAVDLLAPTRVAARLQDQPDAAKALLIAAGPAAEAPVLAAAAGITERTGQAALVEVLDKIGTAAAVPTVQRLSASTDSTIATAARGVLVRLSKGTADEFRLALEDFRSTDPARRKLALATLAGMKKNDRAAEVAPLLTAALTSNPNESPGDLGRALAVWTGSASLEKMTPLMANEAGTAEGRAIAFGYAAEMKSDDLVLPVLRWIIKEPDLVVATLSQMGPVAEPETMKLLRDKNNAVRASAARVLGKIGTAKSIPELRRASTDPRDRPAADVAKRALAEVQQRSAKPK